MNLYVIQVKTGKEDTYIRLWERKKGHLPLRIFWLRKELMIRKNGHTHKGLKSIFPGYLFLEAEDIDPDTLPCGGSTWCCAETEGMKRRVFVSFDEPEVIYQCVSEEIKLVEYLWNRYEKK